MIQTNLLPWRELKRKAQKKRFIAFQIVAFLVALLIILIFHIYFKIMLNNQLNLNNYLQSEINSEQAMAGTVKTQQAEQEKIEKQLKLIINLYKNNYFSVTILKELSSITPATIILNRIERKKDHLLLQGSASSNDEISAYMQIVEKSPVFLQPQLTNINNPEGTQAESDKKYFQLDVLPEIKIENVP